MKNKKIFKTILSIIMSFLIIFIAAMFARSITSNILPQNSKIAIFLNDYLDMMMQKVDSVAVRLKIKRNSVSQYQVDLISQSITDYVGYSLSQTSDLVTSYNPNKKTSSLNLDEYKKSYYKMTLENPYLKSMTIFNTDGKMTLNLYISGNKSWPIELNKNLIENIKTKGSYVIHATNENSFYVMQYMKNKYGEFIVATRNDYSYISDIALYYQVADKTLYVSDSESSVYTVKESGALKNIDNISSVISRFAFYKKQPSFDIGKNIGLSVALMGKEYPNYFELIVLAITAFFIVVFQFAIKGLTHFFGYIAHAHKKRMEDFPIPSEDIPMIDEDIIKKELPKYMAYENTKESQEVFHKISDNNEQYSYTENKNTTEENASAIINTVFKSKANTVNTAIQEAIEDVTEDLREGLIEEVSEENINTIYDGIKTVSNLKEEKEEYEEKIETEKDIKDIIEEETKEDILVSKLDKNKYEAKTNYTETEDVFSSFDRMLSSIITRAEQDARETLAKKS